MAQAYDDERAKIAATRERQLADAVALKAEMLAALKAITERYVSLAGSGDCGFWNPEEEPEVQAARAVIAKAEGR